MSLLQRIAGTEAQINTPNRNLPPKTGNPLNKNHNLLNLTCNSAPAGFKSNFIYTFKPGTLQFKPVLKKDYIMRILLTLALFVFSTCCMKSQDTLFRKDGKLLLGKIISTGDTVQYTDLNGAKGTIQWVRMVDLTAIHFANGKVINLGVDPRQNQGKIFVKFGGAASNERRSLFPGFDNAYSVFGAMFTAGIETRKLGKKHRFSFDIEAGYVQKGGFAHIPDGVYDKAGNLTAYYDQFSGEKLKSLELFSAIKYHVYKGFYAKVGLGINRMTSYKVMVNSQIPYIPTPIPMTSGLDDLYIKTTCGIVYGIGFVTLPKRVGFLFEMNGMNDLSPIGVTTPAHSKYFGNSIVMDVGLFINLYKEKK